jgi:Flp pilus assembly protein TadG
MRRLLSCFSRFWSDRSGNIALIFGLAIVPVMGSIGAAVDYSVANASRAAMQASLDNAALALSKQMPLSQSDMNTNAWNVFTGNLGPSPVVIPQGNLVITSPTTGKLVLDVTGTYTLGLGGVLKLVGMNTSVTVGAHSEVQWGNSRLRVALVLDNTGSMADAGKIDALKTATKNLITQLKNLVTTTGDVYISIIPFSRDVNVGSGNYNASWIDWTDWDAANGATMGNCSKSGYTSQSTCTAAGTCSISGKTSQNTCGTCSKSQYTSKSQCQNNNGTWTAATWTPATWTIDHSQWNGCVMDRGTSTSPGTSAGYDQKIDAPVAGNAATQFAADQYSACTLAIMGLSYDWTTMSNLVNSMTPNGNTNQPIGLVWGWQSLVGGGPLTAPALDSTYSYNQVIILLSDGLNTQDRWYSAQTSIDNRMYYKSGSTVSGTCKNIKDTGIKVYTVQVNTGGDPTSTLLQNCASDPSMFFMLTSSSQIVATFNQIGTALSNLHLSM